MLAIREEIGGHGVFHEERRCREVRIDVNRAIHGKIVVILTPRPGGKRDVFQICCPRKSATDFSILVEIGANNTEVQHGRGVRECTR